MVVLASANQARQEKSWFQRKGHTMASATFSSTATATLWLSLVEDVFCVRRSHHFHRCAARMSVNSNPEMDVMPLLHRSPFVRYLPLQ